MRGEAIDKILTDILSGPRAHYLGVFSRDQLPLSTITHHLAHTSTRYPSAYIAKTDPSSLPGDHWVAFYHLSPIHLEFFDSYGPLPMFITYPSHPLSLK